MRDTFLCKNTLKTSNIWFCSYKIPLFERNKKSLSHSFSMEWMNTFNLFLHLRVTHSPISNENTWSFKKVHPTSYFNHTNYALITEQWISWYNGGDTSNSISRHNMPFKQDKFIIIPKPGFYYVYTQLTYKDMVDPSRGMFRVGHEVIRNANCGQGESEPLLTSYTTQA